MKLSAPLFALSLLINPFAIAETELLTTPACQKAIGNYLELTPVFLSHEGIELLGMDAVWDEDLYLEDKAPISLLFSSEKVQYLYYEGTDVSGTVYRCDVQTGLVRHALKPHSHYASCEAVNEAIRREENLGAVQFDFCKNNPEL